MTPAPPTVTRKERLWLACRQKRCCYAPVVVPTGRDVWRIARALDAPLWSFLVYFQAGEARRDAFLLDRTQPPYRLALAKRPGRRTKTPPPCVFLLRTRDGHHRCGLGDRRPVLCRAFPSESLDGVLALHDGGACTCRTWSLTDADLAEELALVAARQAAAAEYCTVVARWNARLLATPEGTAFDFLAFCDFLLTAYDEIAAGGGDPPRGAEADDR